MQISCESPGEVTIGKGEGVTNEKMGKRSFLDEEKVRSESKNLAQQSSHVHCLTSLSFSLCVPGIGSERQFWGGSKFFKRQLMLDEEKYFLAI